MKNQLALIVGIAVVVILLVYMVTFQVRYDQVAVLTTFDRVTEGSFKTDPGLYFKAPWPIQREYTYSTRLHVLEDRAEQVRTSDNHSVVVKMYLTWRIEDPYAFYMRPNTEERAQRDLQPLLRDLTAEFAEYRFDQLVTPDPNRLVLREIEERALQEMRQRLASLDYGIHVEQIGISRILLPETATEKVFEAMRTTRERLAQAAIDEGHSQATEITSRAESIRGRILAFADTRARAIRDQGYADAAEAFREYQQDPEFASFLRKMEALRVILRHNTTFILDANKLWFLSPLREGDQPAPAQVQTPRAPAGPSAQVDDETR